MADRLSKREIFYSFNSLNSLVRGLIGEYSTIDLRNDSSVHGLIDNVDGCMNVTLSDAVFCDALGKEFYYELFFLRERQIRYVHIPESHYGSLCVKNKIGRCSDNLIVLNCFHSSINKHVLTKSSFNNNKGKFYNLRYQKKFSTMANENNCGLTLKLSDYDCIGFDLDNTICEYNLKPLIQMEYNALVNYLCEFKGYPQDIFKIPLEESNMNFLQRGLLLDLKRGNILKINYEGTILKAYHGTKEMTDSEIIEIYGELKQWEVSNLFRDNMISTWNGPLATDLRTLLDFFDISASLAFAHAVDYNDKINGNISQSYQAGEDIRSALVHTYKREHFQSEESKFFRDMKANQSKYTLKCDPAVINWLKRLKEANKITFLLTGSNIDFASFTAEYCLGKNWRDLFDIVVCYARKPGFFVNNLPFIALDGFKETVAVTPENLKRGSIYSQGNWKDLNYFFTELTGKITPKIIYFGDNVVQDVFSPSRFCGCDTVAVIEELNSDSNSSTLFSSDKWGSYFKIRSAAVPSTIWENAIRKYSRICIPSMKYIASIPLDAQLETFSNNSDGKTGGFHPDIPASFREIE